MIYADPPWDWKAHSPKGESRSAKRHYRTLPLDEIKALPVASLAAPNCALFLWIIRPLIFDAPAIVEAWGFTGKSIAFVWVKPRKDRQADLLNPERDFPFGNGYRTRANAEICLLATRGAPKRLHADVRDVIEAPRQRHSRNRSKSTSASRGSSASPMSSCLRAGRSRARTGPIGAMK